MRVLAKVLDLEDSQDGEGKPVCHVTLKLAGESRQRSTVVAALKDKHLMAGVHNDLRSLIGQPIMLNLSFMLSERKEIIWFFPAEDRDGVRPILYQPSGFLKVDGKTVDTSTGEIIPPKSDNKPAIVDPLKRMAG